MTWNAVLGSWFSIGFVLAVLLAAPILAERERPWWHGPLAFVGCMTVVPPVMVLVLLVSVLESGCDFLDDVSDTLQGDSWRGNG